MKTTFVNKNLPMSPIGANLGNGTFDLVGKLLQIQTTVNSFEQEYKKLDENHIKLSDRQNKESKEVKSLIDDMFFTEYFSQLSVISEMNGKVDSIIFFAEESDSLEIDAFEVKGLNKNLSILELSENSIYKNSTIYSSFKKKCYFSEIYFKVPNNQRASFLILNKKLNDVISVKVRSEDGSWLDLNASNAFMESISPSDKCFFDINFEQENQTYLGSNEFKIVIKNNKIGNNYYSNLMLKLLRNDTKPITSKSIFYTAKNVVSSLTLDSQNLSFFDGHVKLNENAYQVQVPYIHTGTDLCISELELIEKYSTYSIFRCPFPVEIGTVGALESILVTSSLNNIKFNVGAFKVSTNKINWFTIDELLYLYSISSPVLEEQINYSSEYSLTPKYFYVKIDSLQSALYMRYVIKKNINCAWPLSKDGKIFFNGTGIAFLEPTANFIVTGKIKGYGDLSSTISFMPIAKLGVD